MVHLNTDYTGYKVIESTNPLLPSLYQDKTQNWFGLKENQYLLVLDYTVSDMPCVDRFKWQDGKYKTIFRKPFDSSQMGRIKAKNIQQECAMDLLMDKSITVKVLTGGYGTGKTMLGVAAACQLIQANEYDRIVWVRNNVEVKDTNSIGALPGTYLEKMSVWAMPLADHLGGIDALETQIRFGHVELEHLGFLRGRDIKNSIIFCSEAEHLTREHVQLLLGRVADGSCLILEGDFRQVDSHVFEKRNGLSASIDKLSGNRLFGYVHLKESVRSETAKLADLLDNVED